MYCAYINVTGNFKHRTQKTAHFKNINSMKKIFLLLWLTLSFSNLALAQEQQERLDSLFTTLKNKNAFNGNVLIADKDKIIFEKSYGLANIKEDIKLSDKSIFNLASVTKQFTAACILLLEEENKLK